MPPAAAGLALGVLSSLPVCSGVYQIAVALSILGSPGRRLSMGISYCASRGVTHGLMGLMVSGFFPHFTHFPHSPFLQWLSPVGIILKLSGPATMIWSLHMLGVLGEPRWIRGVRDMGFSWSQQSTIMAAVAGIAISLAPCPEGAALFFGILLPHAAKLGPVSSGISAACFGIGSALTPFALAMVSLWGNQRFLRIALWDGRYTKILAGTALLLIGLYMTLAHVYHLF